MKVGRGGSGARSEEAKACLRGARSEAGKGWSEGRNTAEGGRQEVTDFF